MKLIFLDIDGVLNNATDDIIHLPEGGFYSPSLVALLNKITDSTDAKIVLSSTWRLGRTLEGVQSILKYMGITAECIGITENLNNGYTFRGNEIFKWINDNVKLLECDGRHNFKSYIILDDDSDMLYWQRNNFVQTHGLVGLTDALVAKSINILNNPPEYLNKTVEYVME